MLEKFDAAGMDQYIALYQEQLNAFMA